MSGIQQQTGASSNGATRAVRKLAGAVAIFYLLAWLVGLIGYHGWHSSLPQCGYGSGYQACKIDSRVYVPWTVYDQWRPVLNGEVSTPTSPNRQPGYRGPYRGANVRPNPPGNPRTKIATVLLAIYLQIQGADLVRQADALPRTCGGFNVELDGNAALLPRAVATPATC